MPVNELMAEGFKLLVLGMGLVFTFLMVLVGAMKLMSAIAMRLDGGDQPQSEGASATPAAPDQNDEEVVAAISAAITQFRKHKG